MPGLVLGASDGVVRPGFWLLEYNGKNTPAKIMNLDWGRGWTLFPPLTIWWHWENCWVFLVHSFPKHWVVGRGIIITTTSLWLLLGVNKWKCLELSLAHCKHWENVSYCYYYYSGAEEMSRYIDWGIMGSWNALLRKSLWSWGLQDERELVRWGERGEWSK